jgi:hypothetical protein
MRRGPVDNLQDSSATSRQNREIFLDSDTVPSANPLAIGFYDSLDVAGGTVHRYRAFISYAKEDRRIARWLQRRLESYRTPRRLIRQFRSRVQMPRRFCPVFLDTEDLQASENGAITVRKYLRESANSSYSLQSALRAFRVGRK